MMAEVVTWRVSSPSRLISQGDQFVVVEFVGFVPWEQAVLIQGQPISVAVEMKEAFNELNAASISAGAFEASDTKKAVVLKPSGYCYNSRSER